MAIDKQGFKNLMASFGAGVTIITTVGSDGAPYGLTATAFTSVSLEPPLILVCVDKKSESHPHLLAAGKFAVSFLARDQENLSNRFARSGGDKFTGVATRAAAGGVPYIEGSIACLSCTTSEVVDAGDHTVFIGLVEAGEISDRAPLLYFRGAYRGLSET